MSGKTRVRTAGTIIVVRIGYFPDKIEERCS